MMIELSPLEVRKKKEDFQRSLRGYDRSEVDSFLDVVADRMEALVSERRQLKEKVATMEEQLSGFRERERALNEALLAAQELREEARTQADKDAELRIEQAEGRARDLIREAEEDVRELERELDRLRTRRARLLRSLRGTLERFEDELAAEEARLDGVSPSAGESRREAADPDGRAASGGGSGGSASEGEGGLDEQDLSLLADVDGAEDTESADEPSGGPADEADRPGGASGAGAAGGDGG